MVSYEDSTVGWAAASQDADAAVMLEGFILSASDVTGTDYGTAWSTC